jgi:hypothetical protein
MNDIDEVLAPAQRHATDFLNSLDRRPVGATVTVDDLRRRLDVRPGRRTAPAGDR